MDEENLSLKEEVKLLRKAISEKKEKKERKPKDFNFPFNARVNKPKTKKNWVTYLYIQENGSVSFKKEKIDEQTTMLDGIPRIATSDMVLRYKNKPFIIQPSWSVKPFSPIDNYIQTEKEKLNAKGYRLLMIRMNQEAIKAKRNANWLLILGGAIIAGIIIYALFFGN